MLNKTSCKMADYQALPTKLNFRINNRNQKKNIESIEVPAEDLNKKEK